MKEQAEELECRIAACECQTRAVRGLAEASQATAVPQAGNRAARARFLSPEHLADARHFLECIRHDIAAAETQRRALTEELTRLHFQKMSLPPLSTHIGATHTKPRFSAGGCGL